METLGGFGNDQPQTTPTWVTYSTSYVHSCESTVFPFINKIPPHVRKPIRRHFRNHQVGVSRGLYFSTVSQRPRASRVQGRLIGEWDVNSIPTLFTLRPVSPIVTWHTVQPSRCVGWSSSTKTSPAKVHDIHLLRIPMQLESQESQQQRLCQLSSWLDAEQLQQTFWNEGAPTQSRLNVAWTATPVVTGWDWIRSPSLTSTVFYST